MFWTCSHQSSVTICDVGAEPSPAVLADAAALALDRVYARGAMPVWSASGAVADPAPSRRWRPPPQRRGCGPTVSLVSWSSSSGISGDRPTRTALRRRWPRLGSRGDWGAARASRYLTFPATVVMDSQSVRMTESRDVRDCDAGRKIKGRKRHAIVESDGQAHKMQAHAADIQYHDGAGLAAASLTHKLAFRAAGRPGCRLPRPTHGDG